MRVRGRVAKLIENDGNHGGTPRAFRNRVQLLCLRAPPVACSDVEEKKPRPGTSRPSGPTTGPVQGYSRFIK